MVFHHFTGRIKTTKNIVLKKAIFKGKRITAVFVTSYDNIVLCNSYYNLGPQEQIVTAKVLHCVPDVIER